VQKDAVETEWKNADGALISTTGQTNRLALPLDPQGDYVLSATFVRRTVGPVNIIFALPDNRQTLGILSARPVGTGRSGLAAVRGAGIQGDNPTVSSNLQVENGRTYQLMAQVIAHAADVDVNVYVDGEPVISYSGPASALALQPIWRLQEGQRLGLASNLSRVEFRDVKLQMLSGKAVLLRVPPEGMKLPEFVSLPGQSSH
jgi:hypothetical protein